MGAHHAPATHTVPSEPAGLTRAAQAGSAGACRVGQQRAPQASHLLACDTPALARQGSQCAHCVKPNRAPSGGGEAGGCNRMPSRLQPYDLERVPSAAGVVSGWGKRDAKICPGCAVGACGSHPLEPSRPRPPRYRSTAWIHRRTAWSTGLQPGAHGLEPGAHRLAAWVTGRCSLPASA